MTSRQQHLVQLLQKKGPLTFRAILSETTGTRGDIITDLYILRDRGLLMTNSSVPRMWFSKRIEVGNITAEVL